MYSTYTRHTILAGNLKFCVVGHLTFKIFGPIRIILVLVLTTLLTKVQNYSSSLWLHVAISKGSLTRLK